VPHLRERFPGLSVSKMIHKDTDLPAGTTDLRDGQMVEGDGVTLLAVHTPGHASDHLCFYLEEERALFSGDLILNGSTSVIPDEDGDLADYMASLRRVQALGVRRIYPAHGPVIEDAPAKIQEYIDHRMDRERQIVDAIGNGARTIPEMVKVIYADVPEKLHAMAKLVETPLHPPEVPRDGVGPAPELRQTSLDLPQSLLGPAIHLSEDRFRVGLGPMEADGHRGDVPLELGQVLLERGRGGLGAAAEDGERGDREKKKGPAEPPDPSPAPNEPADQSSRAWHPAMVWSGNVPGDSWTSTIPHARRRPGAPRRTR